MIWGSLLAAVLAFGCGYVLRWAKTEDEKERAGDPDPALPLNRSWLCVECDWISGASVRCPRCGCGSLISLSRLVFREVKR